MIACYRCTVVVLRWEPLIKNNARVSVWEALLNKHPRVSVTTAGLLLLYDLFCVSVACFFTIVSSGWDISTSLLLLRMYVCMSESSAMCFSQTCRCVPMRTTINPQPPFHLGVADIYALGMPHHSRLSSYPFPTKSTVSLSREPPAGDSPLGRSPLVYIWYATPVRLDANKESRVAPLSR